jgi:hypothetical protein
MIEVEIQNAFQSSFSEHQSGFEQSSKRKKKSL